MLLGCLLEGVMFSVVLGRDRRSETVRREFGEVERDIRERRTGKCKKWQWWG